MIFHVFNSDTSYVSIFTKNNENLMIFDRLSALNHNPRNQVLLWTEFWIFSWMWSLIKLTPQYFNTTDNLITTVHYRIQYWYLLYTDTLLLNSTVLSVFNNICIRSEGPFSMMMMSMMMNIPVIYNILLCCIFSYSYNIQIFEGCEFIVKAWKMG